MTFEFNDFRIFTFKLNEWHQNFYNFHHHIFYQSRLRYIQTFKMTSASSSSLWSHISLSPSLHRVGWWYIIPNLLPCLCLFCISLSLLLPRCPSLGWCYITILRPWWRHRSNAGSGGKFYAGLKLFLETTSKSSKLSQNIFNINITTTRIKIKLFLTHHQIHQHRYVPLTRSMFIRASY